MNNKVDDVLYKLVETKKFIAKVALNDNSNTSYENTIKGLNNIIVDYTMNNKMSRKEILDITFSLYDIEVEKTFLDKVKDFLNIPKHIKNTKEKIIENHKKKETKKQYEKEIESLVKDKLKEMIKQDKLDSQNKVNDDKVFKMLEFFDKYRLAIYGAVGGILITVLVVVIIWPDRIATLKDGTQPVAEIDGYTVTANDLYEDMKDVYSISSLLDKIDNKILVEKYPETDEMNDELKQQAESYYSAYKQYYKMDKETFLSNNGFGSEKAFLEYLRLQYRRNKYAEDYIKTLISDKEVEKYYEDKVYGDINTKHILVKVDSSASDEDKKKAEDLAKEIISKLNDGKSFDDVKEEYKDQITYEELGYKSYNANLESAYMEAMQKLENNSYSKEPVKTSYGYHVIYRIDQKEKPALEDVKEEIIDSLVSEKKSEDKNISYVALDKMREESGLKFSDTVLEKKYNTYMSQYK
mgnify:CR=1 FL=1